MHEALESIAVNATLWHVVGLLSWPYEYHRRTEVGILKIFQQVGGHTIF